MLVLTGMFVKIADGRAYTRDDGTAGVGSSVIQILNEEKDGRMVLVDVKIPNKVIPPEMKKGTSVDLPVRVQAYGRDNGSGVLSVTLDA